MTVNYDEANCLGLSPCQNVGHQTSMTDAAGSEAWAYQINSGNSVHKNQRTTNSQTKTSMYTLDLAGNITQMIYPSGRTVNYAYDNANRLKSATDAVNGLTYATGFQTPPTNTACVASAVCYTPQGTPYAMSVGQSSTFTGLNITESFNSRLQPNQIKASSTGGNAMDLTYGYTDPIAGGNAGHVFSISNNLDSARSQTFGYDQLNRIGSAQTNSTYTTSPTKCWGETYTLDAWANLTAISPTTNSAYTGCSQEGGFSQTANASNRLSGFQYDASGNTTQDTVYNYSWNAESQLVYTTGGELYGYDGNGRRVSKLNNYQRWPKLYWYGSGDAILTETSPGGLEITDYVYFGGRRVASVPNDLTLNGGFEAGMQGWSVSSTGTGTAQVVTNAANAHSGNSYLYVSVPADNSTTTVTSTQPISAYTGETITAAGWAYHETNSTAYTRWYLSINGNNGQCALGGPGSGNSTLNQWNYQVISVTIPSGCLGPFTVTVYAQVNSAYGMATAARFDDITLNGNTVLFAEDSLGTTRVATDTSGVVCYDADFYPYGGERTPYTNTCNPVYKFEGKERDAETNNDYFGARYYSNRFGRWLSSDWSAVPVPVPYANLANPQTLNLYSMVADDPESFADLDGHAPNPNCDEVTGLCWLKKTAQNIIDDIRGTTFNGVASSYAQGYKGASQGAGELLKDVNHFLNDLGIDTGSAGHVIDNADTYSSNDAQKAGKAIFTLFAFLGGGGESKAEGQVHHLASDKAIVSGFTKQFKEIFARASMNLQDQENLMRMLEHSGRHGAGYNPYVLERLTTATKGLEGQQYRNAVIKTLRALRTEISENPKILKMK